MLPMFSNRVILTFAQDLEFASIMVQNLNNNLITAPELADLRKRLRNLESKVCLYGWILSSCVLVNYLLRRVKPFSLPCSGRGAIMQWPRSHFVYWRRRMNRLITYC